MASVARKDDKDLKDEILEFEDVDMGENLFTFQGAEIKKEIPDELTATFFSDDDDSVSDRPSYHKQGRRKQIFEKESRGTIAEIFDDESMYRESEEDDDESMDEESEEEYYNCACGKVLISLAEFKTHRLRCKKEESDYEPDQISDCDYPEDSDNELKEERGGDPKDERGGKPKESDYEPEVSDKASDRNNSEDSVGKVQYEYGCFCCDQTFCKKSDLMNHSCHLVNEDEDNPETDTDKPASNKVHLNSTTGTDETISKENENQVDTGSNEVHVNTSKNDVKNLDGSNENDGNEKACNDSVKDDTNQTDEKSAKTIEDNKKAVILVCRPTVFARVNSSGRIVKYNMLVVKSMYRCFECNHRIYGATDFGYHKLRHENEKAGVIFKCKFCQKKFHIEADLQLHENHSHLGKHLPYKCSHCDEQFKTCIAADTHLLHKHDKFSGQFLYKCVECSSLFRDVPQFQNHMDIHVTKILENNFSCDTCTKSYPSQLALAQHQLTHERYVCEICGKTYSKSRLLIHKNSHATLKKYECHICKKRFAQRSNQRKHMRIHTGEKPYECDICKQTFNHKVSLKTHKKSKHNIDWWAAKIKKE